MIVDTPRMVLDDTGKKLHFTEVHLTDQANYTCRVNHTFYGKWMNEEQSHSTFLFVNGNLSIYSFIFHHSRLVEIQGISESSADC